MAKCEQKARKSKWNGGFEFIVDSTMYENVVCNNKNPLENMRRVHMAYQGATFVFDTKMSEFHNQTMELFSLDWDWLLRESLISHMHINDYNGWYMD